MLMFLFFVVSVSLRVIIWVHVCVFVLDYAGNFFIPPICELIWIWERANKIDCAGLLCLYKCNLESEDCVWEKWYVSPNWVLASCVPTCVCVRELAYIRGLFVNLCECVLWSFTFIVGVYVSVFFCIVSCKVGVCVSVCACMRFAFLGVHFSVFVLVHN